MARHAWERREVWGNDVAGGGIVSEVMRRTLSYRPRYADPPRQAAAPRTPPGDAPGGLTRRADGRVAGPDPDWGIRSRLGRLERSWWVLGGALLLALLANALGAQVAPVPRGPIARRAIDSALAVATADSAWARVKHTYYDTTFRGLDWEAVGAEVRARAARARDERELRAAITAMFDRLGESHFALVPSGAVEHGRAAPSEEDSLGTAGIELRLLRGRVVVSRVVPGSAAAGAGVRAGWWLERVGALEVAPLVRTRLASLDGAARRLAELQLTLSLAARTHGRAGERLRLAFRDGRGRRRPVRLVLRRDDAELVRFGPLPPQLVRFESRRLDDAAGCVGVVRFNAWMAPVAPRFDDAMAEYRHCRGVILDLRGNVGGVAAMVMGVGGYVLDSAVSLGTMTTRGAALRYVANPRRSDRRGRPLAPYAGELAILVDGMSASTSEIFAAAMQVLGRARVFGEPTAGQALPAMLAPLPNGDVMQHVVGDFVAPDGRRLEARGVVPNVQIQLSRAALLAGRDEVLRAALSWIGGGATATSRATASTRRATPATW